MRIDPKKCVACGNCVAVCPMSAIYIDAEINRAVIDRDECVECYTCHRMSTERLNPTLLRLVRWGLRHLRLRFDPEPDVCPTSAIVPDELAWPRTVRRAFSDVQATHESTGILGRGTEEVKTNDVTGRIDVGEVGFTVELGRPGVGTWFADIQAVTTELARRSVQFEDQNPITHLMADRGTGRLDPDIMNEKVLSAIIEFRTPIADAAATLELLDELADRVETVIAVGVYARCDERGHSEVEDVLAAGGFDIIRAKTNLGLGRAMRA